MAVNKLFDAKPSAATRRSRFSVRQPRRSEEDRPVFICHLDDFDPSGVDAARKIEAELRSVAPGASIPFERLAVTPEQVAAWSLPTRPTKTSDSRARSFGSVFVELDAIAPGTLRDLVRAAIQRHLPRHELEMLQRVEAEGAPDTLASREAPGRGRIMAQVTVITSKHTPVLAPGAGEWWKRY